VGERARRGHPEQHVRCSDWLLSKTFRAGGSPSEGWGDSTCSVAATAAVRDHKLYRKVSPPLLVGRPTPFRRRAVGRSTTLDTPRGLQNSFGRHKSTSRGLVRVCGHPNHGLYNNARPGPVTGRLLTLGHTTRLHLLAVRELPGRPDRRGLAERKATGMVT